MTTLFGRLEAVDEYLRSRGWTPLPPGPAGSLWIAPSEMPPARIAVPTDLSADDIEYDGVISRIASHEHRSTDAVKESIRGLHLDVARLRAANDYLISGSIPINAGVELVRSASRMLRASATTAQRPRAQIGSSFSRLGDEIAKTARFGHTQEGSYILPLLMPVGEVPPARGRQESLPGLDVERVAWEPAERRVMRTLAEALGAVSQVVVKPAQEPRARDLPKLVAAGVSRELVKAVHDVVSDTGVTTFDLQFSWAGAIRPPTSAPTQISVPSEAAELLDRTAKLLSQQREPSVETVSGPVVEVRHVPGDPFGTIAIQGVLNSRPSEVRVTLREPDLDEAHEWMRSARTIIVEGQVLRQPGHPLRIENPLSAGPLDRQFLPDAEN